MVSGSLGWVFFLFWGGFLGFVFVLLGGLGGFLCFVFAESHLCL